jgi:hypothetical protein
VFSEVDYRDHGNLKTANKAALIRDPWKLIHDRSTGTYELYERTSDPEELHNLLPAGIDSSAGAATETPLPSTDAHPEDPVQVPGQPGEERWRPVLVKLKNALDEWENRNTIPAREKEKEEAPITDEELEQLKSLGYL